MDFAEFEERAWELWRGIPEAYRRGVDALIIERDATPHPELADVYTLGECLTERYPAEVGGPESTRSTLLLYYGSFWRLSRLDDDFDWEEELWETITHELQHHLESLADDDALVDMDYAADESFKRIEGRPFDPEFYRYGQRVDENVYRVERAFFLELSFAPDQEPREALFEWEGRRYRARCPARIGDRCFIGITAGLDTDGDVTLVLVRRGGLGEGLRRLLSRGGSYDLVEAEARAEPATG